MLIRGYKIHGLQVDVPSWEIKAANSGKAVGGISAEGPVVSDNGTPFTAADQDDDIMAPDNSTLWMEVLGLPPIEREIGVHKMYTMKVQVLLLRGYLLYIRALIVLHYRVVSCMIHLVFKNGFRVLYGVAFVIILIRIPHINSLID